MNRGAKPLIGPTPARRWTPARMSLGARLLAGGIALACLGVFLLASRIDPARSGTGTHLQIGLPPCGMMDRTGIPCGTCGMTTSFAHFVRGNLAASAFVQPFGMLLAIACAAAFWTASHAAVTGRPAYRVLRRLSTGWTAGILLSAWLLAWAWKILLVLSRSDGW